ncbi:MAG: DUF4340 domain-containing protein [Deltaproteobacteria bacterium]|nr:DUF4340 domain-containing protein [Deltaproteobacteria bacterium]
MHPRQIRVMGVLAAVLLVLVALLVYVDPPEDRDEDGHPGPARVWTGLQAEDVTRIEVERAQDGIRMVVERDGDGWRLVEPFQAPADRWHVEDMASRLASLEAGDPIDAPDPEPFGLGDPPRATATFTDAEGEVRVLVIGDVAPVGSNTYVRTSSDGPVRAAAGQVDQDFLRPLDDYRSRDPWKVAARDVDAVQWRSPTGGGALKQDEHGWWLASGRRADEAAVDALLKEAENLRIASFSGSPEGATFERGTIVLVVDGAEHRIEVGDPVDGGVPARIPLSETPVLLEDGVLALVDRDERDLPLSPPLPVRHGSLDALQVTLGDLSFQDTRKDGLWQEEATLGFLDAFSAAVVDRGQDRAVDTPWGRIELTEKEGRKEILLIGAAAADGSCPARDEAGGPPMVIDASTIQAWRDALGQSP